MNRIEYLLKVFAQAEPLLRSKLPLQRPTNVYLPGLTAQPWHDPQNFEWAQQLEKQYKLIQQELLNISATDNNRFIPYREPEDFFPNSISEYNSNNWYTFPFSLYGRNFGKNCELCPVTTNILQSIPRITGVVHFSALTTRHHITPHSGPFNFILRCQLPLIVPNNSILRVAHESRKLVEGKLLIFDDSFVHEAWNYSNSSRIVLLFDIYHPDLTDDEISEFEFMITHNPDAQKSIQKWFSCLEEQKKATSDDQILRIRS